MTARHTPEVLIARDEIVAAPAPRACEDQSFELPGGLYAAMTVMFAGFIMMLGSAFRGGHMAVAYGVIFAFLAAFFAIPAMFQQKRGLTWGCSATRASRRRRAAPAQGKPRFSCCSCPSSSSASPSRSQPSP